MAGVLPRGPDPDVLVRLLLPGIGLIVWGVVYLAIADGVGVIRALLTLCPGVALLLGGYAVSVSSVPVDRYGRIFSWTTGAALGLLVVVVVMMLSPAISISKPIVAMELALGVGGFGGLLIGFNEVRAMEQARTAERNRLAAERAREEQVRLEHLNHLLRHDLLNDLSVIRGHAELLLDDENADERHATVIKRQTDAAVELIENVRTYLESIDEDDGALKPKHLSAILSREVDTLESSFPESVVVTDVPDGVYVRADDLLGSVFSNLLRNAVVHNDASAPEVAVRLDVTDGTARITIADNGPGLPQPLRENPFERNEHGNHGFGLFLVKTLVDRYDGSVTVEKTDSSGTTFAVELPRAMVE